MDQRSYMDLLELQEQIKEGIADAFPGRYWVKAEISSWSPRANGHCYLSLTQSRGGKVIAESRAMIWKWHYPQLKAYFEETTGQALQAGITVLVKVQLAFSELYGMSLYIEDIDAAFTLGEQALERKKILEALRKGGYLEMQQELALPDIPRRLALITSSSAAGYQDFRNHLLNNPEGYAFQLELFQALMQGEQAPASIAEALEEAAKQEPDAILILRGGGSELDLACFDDYDLAVSIAGCPVPVVTAIGHDKDVHMADLVAHASVKTPTALADLFLEAMEQQDGVIDRLKGRIASGLRQMAAREELRVKEAESAIRQILQRRVAALDLALQRSVGRIATGLTRKYAAVARLTDQAVHRIRFAAGARLSAEVSAVALREARIKATDPRNILGLGYVLVTGKDNQVLKTVDKVGVGDRIGVRFSDGSLTARVDQVFAEGKDQCKTA